MHDAVMAAFLVDARRIGDYLSSVFAQQTDFFDDTTKDKSRMEIYARMAAIGRQCAQPLAGVRLGGGGVTFKMRVLSISKVTPPPRNASVRYIKSSQVKLL